MIVTTIKKILNQLFNITETDFQLDIPINAVCADLDYLSDLIAFEQALTAELGQAIFLTNCINPSLHSFEDVVELCG